MVEAPAAVVVAEEVATAVGAVGAGEVAHRRLPGVDARPAQLLVTEVGRLVLVQGAAAVAGEAEEDGVEVKVGGAVAVLVEVARPAHQSEKE